MKILYFTLLSNLSQGECVDRLWPNLLGAEHGTTTVLLQCQIHGRAPIPTRNALSIKRRDIKALISDALFVGMVLISVAGLTYEWLRFRHWVGTINLSRVGVCWRFRSAQLGLV